ncbi:GIY-YIG nuclease family protein [Fibrella sp. HMF5036]|uniref:GIY-YIG nuclease family protein n=2 Tax=Fibrella aquatilis TaxID=2817059 RepID=A0A939GAX0_9BACT|nr:GIY-YIG nuclease family protein [Fibrella aquatilis]
MVDRAGQRTWEAQTTSYGRIRLGQGTRAECPFRFQGQYEDVETGLYYNRFRYYAPQEGMYISQDPIKLAGGSAMYRYAHDSNRCIDPLGLAESVYQLVDSNGKVIYYGITDRKPQARVNEHRKAGKQFDHMEVIAENLTHDQARSLEGGLIRNRLAERIGDYGIDDSIETKLQKSGLLNKNRGREIGRWNPTDPLTDVPRLKKTKILRPNCK